MQYNNSSDKKRKHNNVKYTQIIINENRIKVQYLKYDLNVACQ